MRTVWQTDVAKLIVAFHNFAWKFASWIKGSTQFDGLKSRLLSKYVFGPQKEGVWSDMRQWLWWVGHGVEAARDVGEWWDSRCGRIITELIVS